MRVLLAIVGAVLMAPELLLVAIALGPVSLFDRGPRHSAVGSGSLGMGSGVDPPLAEPAGTRVITRIARPATKRSSRLVASAS